MMPLSEVVRLACNLAKNMNWHVFPCLLDKRPACPGGFKAAATNEAAIGDLWKRYPGELIGVATGTTSGHDILDVDVKHPAAIGWWRANQPRLPATRTWRTQSGGLHVAFRHAEGVRNTAGTIAQGIDTRGDGGYRIAWSATPGIPAVCHSPIAEWPSWLLDILLAKPATLPPTRMERDWTGNPTAAIAGLLRAVAVAAEGQRNATLFWAANRAREKCQAGSWSEVSATSELVAAAAACGLPEVEARQTVASAFGRRK